ncbi:UNVERIFIED_CONTAM: hypothetical protein Slati_3805900 [Sesamum latifolium]|uniref:Uncharacterized protein n=1 Tax=Sesamum latifolium TaxID=2727402 RepID=A0AAW2U668_9LAMI
MAPNIAGDNSSVGIRESATPRGISHRTQDSGRRQYWHWVDPTPAGVRDVPVVICKAKVC